MNMTADTALVSNALHRTVWRWHFYAGLFCIPFVVWLAVTGSIYLFKPQIEALIDRRYDHLEVTGAPVLAESQVKSALAALPGATLRSYELPQTPHSAVRVIVAQNGVAKRVYVHPETLQILKIVQEDDRFMSVIFRLHGQLLMGDRGSVIVELAASWAIVMIVTGLYLWWPRRARGLGGILYPRLAQGGRMFWRDLHAVTGLWVSAFALFILLSGLPWAKSWGAYFKEIRQITGTAVAKQDWPSGGAPRDVPPTNKTAADDMAGMPGMAMPGRDMAGAMSGDYENLSKMIATVAPLNLAYPVLISPPARAGGNWIAKSDAQNRPLRTDIALDGASGAIVQRIDFSQRHIIDRIVGVGAAAHEGQLFGWANQLLSLMTASGLIAMSVSAVMLWMRRRQVGALGAPARSRNHAASAGLILIIIGFGVFLPLLGASIIIVGLIERLILVRIPRVREWLGLRPSFSGP